jgi:ketosteroid isomerase-like protein
MDRSAPGDPEKRNLATALRYIESLSSGMGADDLTQFFTPDVVQEEFPNRLLPSGATRDLAALKEARVRGKGLLSAERFEVLGTMSDGDSVALELRWIATVGIKAGPFETGQELRARFAVFLEFRDGRIARQRNYDCFDPWP